MSNKGNRQLVRLGMVAVLPIVLVALLLAPLGAPVRAGLANLWQGFLRLPGIAWLLEDTGASPHLPTEPALSTNDARELDAILQAGSALQEQGAYDEALDYYRQALERNRAHVPTHVALASLYLELGREQDAIRELEEAATLAPQDTSILTRLGMLYLRHDNVEEAVDVLARAKELDPENPLILYGLSAARTYRSYLDAQQAVTDLEKAAEMAPNNADIYAQLAQAYVQRNDPGDEQRAIQALEKAMKLDPANVEPYFYLGQLYLRVGQVEDAIAAWQHYVAESEDAETVQRVREWLRDLTE